MLSALEKNERHNSRELAVSTLYSLDFNNNLSADVNLDELPGFAVEELDSLNVTVVVYAKLLITGILNHLEEIDSIITEHSLNRPIEKINFVDRNILRLSIFSLLYEKELHKSIIINEAIHLSQEMSTDVTYKFINGLLDAAAQKLGR